MIIGHTKQVAILEEAARANKLNHAQVFIGPKYLGKAKIALHLSVILQEAEDDVIYKKHIYEGKDPDTMLFLDDGSGQKYFVSSK